MMGFNSDDVVLKAGISGLQNMHQIWTQENPVRSGIAAKAADYLYSSARAYARLQSVLDI
jgi:hypothetical protein